MFSGKTLGVFALLKAVNSLPDDFVHFCVAEDVKYSITGQQNEIEIFVPVKRSDLRFW